MNDDVGAFADTSLQIASSGKGGRQRLCGDLLSHGLCRDFASSYIAILSGLPSEHVKRNAHSQPGQLISANNTQKRLINDSKHLYDIFVLLLGDKLGDVPDIVHRALRIRDAHVPVQEVDSPESARVVVAVLRPGHRVQLEVHADSVLARPLQREQDVVPRLLLEERFARPRLDRPVRDGQTDPVQACAGYLREVLLGLR